MGASVCLVLVNRVPMVQALRLVGGVGQKVAVRRGGRRKAQGGRVSPTSLTQARTEAHNSYQ